MINAPAASPEFLALFRDQAGPDAAMSFERFMELALYAPDIGYYRRDRTRVGYGRNTDFFTATTSGAIFGELIAAACVSLLAPLRARDFHFVEIGAEPSRGVLDGVAHPFASATTLRLGEPLRLSGSCVVFSNELFDAQPFRRFLFRAGAWRELGVALRDGQLTEIEIASTLPALLPLSAPEGYVFDAPMRAAELAREMARLPWSGLFVACDYGKSWRELMEACPAGTARAYHRHKQSNDLLAQPGEQDLTCHICWDWLQSALADHGFSSPAVESQESFFIRRAGEFIAATSAEEAARFSPRKLSLMQLLHPAHLGQKFQVLHAVRR